jgi:aminopeptidase N
MARIKPIEGVLRTQEAAPVDALDYDLRLAIDPDAPLISGSVTITARVVESAVDSVEIDLYESMTVDSIAVDDSVAGYSRTGNKVTVDLGKPPAAGDTVRIHIAYGGRPEALGFGSFVFTEHGQDDERFDGVFSLSEPWYAPTWWPCIDRPDDKATCRVTVEVPSGWTAVSNGTLADSAASSGGGVRMTWEEKYPIATYLVSVAATNYAHFHEAHRDLSGRDIDLDYYVYPEHLSKAQIDFAETGAMIDSLSTIFGPYPFADEKYGLSEFSFRGGMEHQTITGIGERFLASSDDYRWILVHELAHQWFGDSLTPADWRDIWLNEGFASYAEALYFEMLDGPAALSEYMAGLKRPQFADVIYDPIELFGITVYYKGAWVLHMLRRLIADDAFFATLRSYVDTYSYGSVSTSDFREVCEAESGLELGWFFDQWLLEGGRPSYVYDWTASPSGSGWELALSIVQTGDRTFKMPLDVRVYGEGLASDLAIVDSLESQNFTIDLDFEPDSLVFDPDGWALADFVLSSGIAADGTVLEIPRFVLDNPHPNPFNGVVIIPFRLSERLDASLSVYNVVGELVAELVSGEMEAGPHRVSWTGRDRSGIPAPSGIYFAVLRTTERRLVKKLVLLR